MDYYTVGEDGPSLAPPPQLLFSMYNNFSTHNYALRFLSWGYFLLILYIMRDYRNLNVQIEDWEDNEDWFDRKFAEVLFISDITFPITRGELKFLLYDE